MTQDSKIIQIETEKTMKEIRHDKACDNCPFAKYIRTLPLNVNTGFFRFINDDIQPTYEEIPIIPALLSVKAKEEEREQPNKANELFEEIKEIRFELLQIAERLDCCVDKYQEYIQDDSYFSSALYRISSVDNSLEGAIHLLEYYLKHNKEENND